MSTSDWVLEERRAAFEVFLREVASTDGASNETAFRHFLGL